MQLGLLGDDWWAWEAGGSFEPCDRFDVTVVVHQGSPSDTTRARYATVRGKADYRFIERGEAIRYLDEQIAELGRTPAGPDEYDFGPLLQTLERTRSTIFECLH